MMHRAWSSIVEVPYCLSRSYVKFQGHTALKIVKFYPNWAFQDSNSSLNSPMAMKCCSKLETAKERCPIVFQGHPSNFKVTQDKTSPILTQIGRFRTIGRSQLSNPSDLPCSIIAHPVNFDIPRERSLKISYQELDIYWYYQYKQFNNWYGFSISIGNTICDLEWEDTVYWPGWLKISAFLLTRLVRSSIKPSWHVSLRQVRCDMAFIGPMHHNKPNITSFLPKK